MRSLKLYGMALLCGVTLLSAAAKKESVDVFKSLETLQKGEKMVLEGEVFYSKPLRFDYDKDGVKNEVMMAARFFIKRKADGKYDGYIQRFLYDVDKKKPVSWYSKKNMLQEPPIAMDTAIKNVKQDGVTVSFDSGPWRYTMTDGGEGYINDKIIVTDKVRTKTVKMFGGDVKVFE